MSIHGDDAWNKKNIIQQLDKTLFGEELARKVVDKFDTTGKGIGSTHRDYCGFAMGRNKATGIYLLGRNDDGMLLYYGIQEGDAKEKGDIHWTDRNRFINWLSVQSDYSMSGADPNSDVGKILKGSSSWVINNQTITRDNMLSFLRE